MSGYPLAWLIILVMAATGTVAMFFLTRPMRPGLFRTLLRVSPGILLVIPAPVPGYGGQLAPAFVVLVFEGLFQRDGNVFGAFAALAVGVALALGAGLVLERFRSAPDGEKNSQNTE